MIKLKWLYLINFCLFGATLLFSTLAQAAVTAPDSYPMQGGREQCASALNSYLHYRHNNSSLDALKLQGLENQIEALCEGYQIRLVDNNGVLSGIVEPMD